MFSIKSLFCVGLLVTASIAAPITPTKMIVRRQDSGSNGASCGSDQYSSSAIAAAQNVAYEYYEQGNTVGKDNYPHQYNDYEGFSFPVPSPWYEFPILESGNLFTGSTGPGADRVIFNGNGDLAGVITHTGASGNNFVACDYSS